MPSSFTGRCLAVLVLVGAMALVAGRAGGAIPYSNAPFDLVTAIPVQGVARSSCWMWLRICG